MIYGLNCNIYASENSFHIVFSKPTEREIFSLLWLLKNKNKKIEIEKNCLLGLLTSFPFRMSHGDGMQSYAWLSGFAQLNFLMVGKNLFLELMSKWEDIF